ncbi:hypothetical protein [Pseudomonas syringae group genomosp. 7]|uniref:hypothetical protein n=1 Tax=Pseudomonas syringae group genomosp. 7 TaxID=251699 RepID=UPI000EFE8775|nr:hypothetical protein [Pseudomonas syringae group genomosp. 7]RMR07137.1 hypothetical protein ALP93_200437 [Pseudomonas syringae pv. helianthi]
MKKLILSAALLALSTSSIAGGLSEEENDISKCVGFVASQKYINPKMMDNSTDIAGVKMKAVAMKNKYPATTLRIMTDTSSNTASIIVNYITTAANNNDKEKINDIYRRGIATCKKSGLTISQVNDKFTVTVDDIDDAL